MQVKNYYTLSLLELERATGEIRMWLFNYSTHDEKPKAEFALRVALNAKELQKDSWVELLIDSLC